MEIKKRYQRWLLRVLAFTVLFTLLYTWYYVKKVIPNQIHLVKDQESDFSFHIPFGFSLSSGSEEVTLGYASDIRSDEIDLDSFRAAVAPINESYPMWDELSGAVNEIIAAKK